MYTKQVEKQAGTERRMNRQEQTGEEDK